ncbi:unnamed protein product, partial [Prorocentrum cordatum]
PCARPMLQEADGAVDQEPSIASVVVQPLLKWNPPAHFDAPEKMLNGEEDKEGPAGNPQRQARGGRSAGLEQDSQDPESQIEILDNQPALSLRINAGEHAPAVQVLRATPGQADTLQGLWRAACLRGLGRPAAPAAEDGVCSGGEQSEDGEAWRDPAMQAVITAGTVNGGGGGEQDMFALLLLVALLCSTLLFFSEIMSHDAARQGRHPAAWYAAQLFPFVLRMMSDTKAWS